MPVGDGAKLPGRMAMRLFRQLKVGDRVAAKAVGAALKQDELRREALEMGFDCGPGGEKLGVAGARRQGQVELAAGRRTRARLACRARARVQEAAVLVGIGKDQRRVILECIEDAVPMVRIDVDVRNAREPVSRASGARRRRRCH